MSKLWWLQDKDFLLYLGPYCAYFRMRNLKVEKIFELVVRSIRICRRHLIGW